MVQSKVPTPSLYLNLGLCIVRAYSTLQLPSEITDHMSYVLKHFPPCLVSSSFLLCPTIDREYTIFDTV